jgi:formamidopyrimidine-DNA glycosylase
MPELPEVEVVRRGLEAQLLGARFKQVEILTPGVVQAAPGLLQQLPGQTLLAVERRAKYLILVLSQDRLLIHLRMTGQVLVTPAEATAALLPLPFTYYQRPLAALPDKHTHGIFYFEDQRRLFYRDIRKFGRVQLLSATELARLPGLLKLGPEPLESGFSAAALASALKSSRRNIKAWLLDQQNIAGLGNIYVDEALFVAGILPQRPAESLKPAEIRRLHQAIPQVLQKGIDAGGTSLKDYLHPDGQRGSHQEHLFVYGRGGQPCFQCQQAIVKTSLAQRGTHYCSRCQR